METNMTPSGHNPEPPTQNNAALVLVDHQVELFTEIRS